MAGLNDKFRRRRAERRTRRLSGHIAAAEAKQRRVAMERDDRIVARGTEGGTDGGMI